MKHSRSRTDGIILGTFVASFFNGLTGPFYISLVLAALDTRVIAAGALATSALPFLIGLVLESRAIFDAFFRALPMLMALETLLSVAVIVLFGLDAGLGYLLAMISLGAFGTAITYLLQRVKERRWAADRAGFDRRSGMAEALGGLTGTLAGLGAGALIADRRMLLALGAVQTAAVYALFLSAYRAHRKQDRGLEPGARVEEEEPHSPRLIQWLAPEACPAVS